MALRFLALRMREGLTTVSSKLEKTTETANRIHQIKLKQMKQVQDSIVNKRRMAELEVS